MGQALGLGIGAGLRVGAGKQAGDVVVQVGVSVLGMSVHVNQSINQGRASPTPLSSPHELAPAPFQMASSPPSNGSPCAQTSLSQLCLQGGITWPCAVVWGG